MASSQSKIEGASTNHGLSHAPASDMNGRLYKELLYTLFSFCSAHPSSFHTFKPIETSLQEHFLQPFPESPPLRSLQPGFQNNNPPAQFSPKKSS
jgi:hypothetical protein